MPRKTFRLDIRDQRLPGERLCISARTSNAKEFAARKQLIDDLLDMDRIDLIERIKSGDLHLSQVRAAMKAQDLESLRPLVNLDISLGTVLDRIVNRAKGGNVAGTIKLRGTLAAQFTKHFATVFGVDDGGQVLISDITSEHAEAFVFGPKKGPDPKKPLKPWGAVRQEQARDMGAAAWDVAIAAEAELAEKTGGRPRLARNPWRAIKVTGGRSRKTVRPAFLQRPEWRSLEAANTDLPELAVCALGCFGGLREGEAVNLRPGIDLDLDARVIRVQERGGAFAWKPKTPRSVRDVPINDRLLVILQRHVELGFAGERYFIRLPRLDQPIALQTVQMWTKRAYTRAGIAYGRDADGLTNHSLRHTFGSWLAQEDVQLMKIAMLMGDTIETVAKYYAHLLPQDLDRAVRIMDATVLKGDA